MADNLTLGNSESDDNNANEVEGIVEFTTNHEYITCASMAWQMVDEIDTAILNKTDERRVKRMKRQALRIVSVCLNEMYEELFDDNNDEPESE